MGVKARVARGTVWVDGAGLELLGTPVEGWVPVPPSALVLATRTVALTPATASEALGHGAEGLAAFGRAALACIAADMAAAGRSQSCGSTGFRSWTSELSTQVYGELAGVVHEGTAQVAATEERALLAACRLVGAAARCDVVEPPRGALLAARDPLAAIARRRDSAPGR